MSYTGEEDMINHSNYLSKDKKYIPLVAIGITGAILMGAYYLIDIHTQRKNTIEILFKMLDANNDKILDPQESGPLVEKGLFQKGISLDELAQQLQNTRTKTLRTFLEERQPKK